MYPYLLILHSFWRWLVLCSLFFACGRSFFALRAKQPFLRPDDSMRHWTATIAHVQFLLGLWLYAISPLVAYFYSDFSAAVKMREIRFFGMEHSLVMFVAVLLITIGSMKAKRQQDDAAKFRTIFRWYGWAFMCILSSVPWPFSPLISRPWMRF